MCLLEVPQAPCEVSVIARAAVTECRRWDHLNSLSSSSGGMGIQHQGPRSSVCGEGLLLMGGQCCLCFHMLKEHIG